MDVIRQFKRKVKKIVWPIDSRKRQNGDDTWNYQYNWVPAKLDNVVALYIDNGCFTRDPAGERYCYLHLREYPGEAFQEAGTAGALHAIAKIRTTADPSFYPPPDTYQPDVSINKPPRTLGGSSLHFSFQDYLGADYQMGEHDFNLCIYVLDDASEHGLNMQATFRHQAENERGPESMRDVVNGQRRALEMGGTFPEYAASGMTAYDTFQHATSQGRGGTVVPRLHPPDSGGYSPPTHGYQPQQPIKRTRYGSGHV